MVAFDVGGYVRRARRLADLSQRDLADILGLSRAAVGRLESLPGRVDIPTMEAILALAESQPVTGAQFLHAFVLGVEAECRIGNAVSPGHYAAGWHITTTCGTFGAAAAAGKLLQLNTQQMTWALGIAATQASGLNAMLGSMSKSLNMGHAAKNGLMAALLAARDFTSSERGIEAPRGFAHVLAHHRPILCLH